MASEMACAVRSSFHSRLGPRGALERFPLHRPARAGSRQPQLELGDTNQPRRRWRTANCSSNRAEPAITPPPPPPINLPGLSPSSPARAQRHDPPGAPTPSSTSTRLRRARPRAPRRAEQHVLPPPRRLRLGSTTPAYEALPPIPSTSTRLRRAGLRPSQGRHVPPPAAPTPPTSTRPREPTAARASCRVFGSMLASRSASWPSSSQRRGAWDWADRPTCRPRLGYTPGRASGWSDRPARPVQLHEPSRQGSRSSVDLDAAAASSRSSAASRAACASAAWPAGLPTGPRVQCNWASCALPARTTVPAAEPPARSSIRLGRLRQLRLGLDHATRRTLALLRRSLPRRQLTLQLGEACSMRFTKAGQLTLQLGEASSMRLGELRQLRLQLDRASHRALRCPASGVSDSSSSTTRAACDSASCASSASQLRDASGMRLGQLRQLPPPARQREPPHAPAPRPAA